MKVPIFKRLLGVRSWKLSCAKLQKLCGTFISNFINPTNHHRISYKPLNVHVYVYLHSSFRICYNLLLLFTTTNELFIALISDSNFLWFQSCSILKINKNMEILQNPSMTYDHIIQKYGQVLAPHQFSSSASKFLDVRIPSKKKCCCYIKTMMLVSHPKMFFLSILPIGCQCRSSSHTKHKDTNANTHNCSQRRP